MGTYGLRALRTFRYIELKSHPYSGMETMVGE
jgi:hypothetical protein